MGGIMDMTTVEVKIKLLRHFREKEYIEGACIKVYYDCMPKTCYNCKLPGSECPTGGGAGYACKASRPEVSWNEMYEDLQKLRDADEESVRRKEKADEVVFKEVETTPASEFEEKIEDRKIPSGFKIAGIRFKGKEILSKIECKELLTDLMEDLQLERVEVRGSLDKADVFEEEVKGGGVRAFSLLMDPVAAEVIWEKVRKEPVCTPIIMSERRWLEEIALSKKKKEEEEKEEAMRKKIKEDREKRIRNSEKEYSFKLAVKNAMQRMKKQMRKIKSQRESWRTEDCSL